MNRLQSLFCFSAFLCCTLAASCLLAQAPKEITNSIGMKLVLIPKGTFMMGSPESEEGRQKDETQHEVTISKDYYLGVYEVTQAQYEKVMGKNPSYFQGPKVGNENADLPVENVSWDAAVEFCKKLSDLPEEKKAGRVYRLPTEAEWEYACRACSKTAYAFDDEAGLLPEYGWFKRNSSDRTHTVGLLEPNAWGYTTCTGTSGSGAATGTVNTPRVPSAIRLAKKRALAACTVAAVGTTLPRFACRRTGSGTRRRSASAPSASALP